MTILLIIMPLLVLEIHWNFKHPHHHHHHVVTTKTNLTLRSVLPITILRQYHVPTVVRWMIIIMIVIMMKTWNVSYGKSFMSIGRQPPLSHHMILLLLVVLLLVLLLVILLLPPHHNNHNFHHHHHKTKRYLMILSIGMLGH